MPVMSALLASPWPQPMDMGPRVARLQRAVRLFVVGILLLIPGPAFVLQRVGRPEPAVAGLFLCLGVGLVLYGSSRWPRTGILVVAVASLTTPLLGFPPDAAGADWPYNAMVYLAVTEFRVAGALSLVGGWAGAFAVTCWAASRPAGMWHVIDFSAVQLPIVYSCTVCLGVFIASLARVDESRSGRLRTQMLADLERQETRLAAEAQRILHDRVLTTLMGVAEFGRVDRSLLDETVEELRRPLALRDAGAADVPLSLPRLIKEAVDAAPIVIDCRMPANAHRWPTLTAAEATAVGRALRELLHNADKHGAGATTLSASHVGGTFRVDVSNRAADRDANSAGWGWRNSVHAPMTSIGGTAVRSREGSTVTASLTWRPQAPMVTGSDAAHRATVDALGVDLHRLLGTLWPVMVGHTLLALKYTPWRWSSWPQLIVAITIWLVLYSTVRTLAQGPPSRLRSYTWGAILLGCVLFSLWWAGPLSWLDPRSWSIGMSILPLGLAAAFAAPGRVLLQSGPLFLVPFSLSLMTPSVGLVGGAGAMAQAVIPWGGYFLGAAFRWVGRQADAAETVLRRGGAATFAGWSASRSDASLVGHTRELVLPFLTELATGRIEPDDPAVRAAAAELAVAARDELNAPGLLDAAIRARVRAARERGVHVTFSLGPKVPREVSAVMLRMLDRLLDGVVAGERVVLEWDDAEAGLRLTVVSARSDALMDAILPTAGSMAIVRGGDEFGSSALLRLNAPLTSPSPVVPRPGMPRTSGTPVVPVGPAGAEGEQPGPTGESSPDPGETPSPNDGMAPARPHDVEV